MKKKFKGELALFTAASLYGFFGILSRLISFNIPFFYQQWIRNLFSVCIIGVLLLLFSKWKNISRKDVRWFFLRSLCGFISFIGLYIAFIKIDISTTYFLSYAASAIGGYTIGSLFFQEKINRTKVISLVLAITGLALVYAVSFNSQKISYLLLAVIAGLSGSGWNAFSKKISGIYSNLQLNFIDFAFETILPLTISIFLGEKWVIPSLSPVWLVTMLLGFMFMIVGILIVYGFSCVEAQTGSIIMLFEVITGIIFAFIFFHETVPLPSLAGGFCILFAIIMPNLPKDILKKANI